MVMIRMVETLHYNQAELPGGSSLLQSNQPTAIMHGVSFSPCLVWLFPLYLTLLCDKQD